MLAYHFLRSDCCLGFDDGRKAVVGETLTVEGTPELCNHGLHASKRIIDALQYAPGPVCCLVEVGGEIVEGHDKLSGTSRKVLWIADISELLHNFACDVAEEALNKRREAGDKIDPRSTTAIEAKRKWLRGEITAEDLAAAWDAARDAAWDAAWDAARDVAWGAAWDAAWDAQNADLEARIKALPGFPL